MENLTIRLETPHDYAASENLTREAFWNVYRPGCTEHYVLHAFRSDPDFVPQLDLVMELDGKLIGHIMFVRAQIHADDGRILPIMTFGPISIHPDYQRRGYGKRLLEHALEKAASMGVGAICIEGNINFYGKSGFVRAYSRGIYYNDLPRDEAADFFLLRELEEGYLDGVTGVYRTPQGYYVDNAMAEQFDRNFPPKQKLKLPGQLFD